jgi:hypothetical protein
MTTIPNPPSLGDTFLNELTGVTYEYDGEKWVIINTPGKEQDEQLGEDLAALTSRVADGETTQGQIQETVTDALVTQSDIQGNIDVLETKVEALEGTVTDGTWRFTSRQTPLQGEFDLLDGTGNKINGNWSLAQFIYLTNPDFLSVNHTFEFLGLEDYIRIGGTGGSAVYRVKSGKTGTDSLVEYQVEHVSSNGTVLDSIAYDFEFTPGFDPTAYATKSYVDDVADTKVDLTGDNIITTAWRIKTAAKSFISITTNEMKLYNIADPTGHEDGWVANKGYVDTEVGKIDSKIDTVVEPLASKEYVDDRIPPTYGSPYKYRNTDTTAQNLQPGEFFIASNNAYFHPFDKQGRELVTTALHNHSTDVAGIFKVYDSTGKLVHAMAFNQYATGNDDNNYCKLFVNHTMRTKSSWSSSATYYLADGFLLPY